MTRKTCSKCLTEKSIADFYENKHNSSGYFSRCKICVKSAQLAWNKTEEGRASTARFNAANREKMKAYHRAYGQSETGKKSRRKFRSSEQGKAAKKAYLERRFGGEKAVQEWRRATMASYVTPEQEAAWKQTAQAIRTGKLIRQPCACGNTRSEAHHEDYNFPLEVIWLCASCHQKHHYQKRMALLNLDNY